MLDREEYNAYMREYNSRKYPELKAQAFAALGDQCLHCEIADHRVLQIDHVNGGGRAHRKSTSSMQVYRHVIKNPDGYQLLCANCHQIKTYSGVVRVS